MHICLLKSKVSINLIMLERSKEFSKNENNFKIILDIILAIALIQTYIASFVLDKNFN